MGETFGPPFSELWEKPLTHFSLATLLATLEDTCSREEAQQERQAGPAKSSHSQGNHGPSPRSMGPTPVAG